MVAPNNNKFWMQRSSHGRKPIFASPDDLWDAACEYFEWVHNNPLYEHKAFNGKDGIAHTMLPKMRAMTMMGLCFYLDIGTSTFHDYKRNEDFSEVISKIEQVIYTQKFEGAAADLLNANIISRELGLADKQDITTNGQSLNKSALDMSKLSDEQLRSLDTIISQASETGTSEKKSH